MPLPVIAGVVRVTAQGIVPGGQKWANVMHFRYSGGASSPGPTDITALDILVTRLYSGTAWSGGAAWFTNCSSSVTLARMSYLPLDGSSLTTDIPKSLTGSSGTGNTPPQSAPVLTLRTAK